MDESLIIVIIVLFFVLAVFGTYMYKNLFVPRQIDELADMIRSGQTEEAIRQLRGMIERDDRNSYLRYLLGEAFFLQKEFSLSAMEFKQVIKLGKFDSKVKEVHARKRLAAIYKQLGQLEEAKKEFLILTNIDPNEFNHFYQVGTIFFNAGIHNKALRYLRDALKLNPRHPESLYLAGQLCYLGSKLGDARKYLVEAVKIKPDQYKAHYFLGLTLRAGKELDAAVQEFEIAQKDRDVYQKACLARGSCFIERNQIHQAKAEFEKGLSAKKRDTETDLNLRYFLAACSEMQRDLHTAISQWERIHEIRPDFRDVKEKLKTYEEFRKDDIVKDFMITSPEKFETVSRQISEKMGLGVLDLRVLDDSSIEMLGTMTQGKWRNTKKTNQLVRVLRSTEPVTEKYIREFHEAMKERNAHRGIILATSDYSPGAQNFVQSRPIDLVDKAQVALLLKSLDKELA